MSETGVSDPGRLATFNHALLEVERDFLLQSGLPRRAWFRHAFYAPGVYTGYAAEILPGVREAIARKDWDAAREQIDLVQGAVERGTMTLTQALQTLRGSEAAPGGQAAPGH